MPIGNRHGPAGGFEQAIPTDCIESIEAPGLTSVPGTLSGGFAKGRALRPGP